MKLPRVVLWGEDLTFHIRLLVLSWSVVVILNVLAYGSMLANLSLVLNIFGTLVIAAVLGVEALVRGILALVRRRKSPSVQSPPSA